MASELERCDRPRRQLVLWSTVLLVLALADVRLSSVVETLGGLGSAAGLLRLIDDHRVIQACLALSVLYFGFRLIVEWYRIPSKTREQNGYMQLISILRSELPVSR